MKSILPVLIIIILPFCIFGQEELSIEEIIALDEEFITSYGKETLNAETASLRTEEEVRFLGYRTEAMRPGSNGWVGHDSLELIYEGENLVKHLFRSNDGSGWYISGETSIEYNSLGQPVMMTHSRLTNFLIWETYGRSHYEYDIDGNLALSTYQSMDENEWVNRWQSIYEYDSEGLKRRLGQKWVDGAWINKLRRTIDFPTDNEKVTTEEEWSVELEWFYLTRDSEVYDSGDSLIQSLRELWTESGWENLFKGRYERNAAHETTFYLLQKWDTNQSVWVDRSRRFTEYNGFDPVVATTHYQTWWEGQWNDGNWVTNLSSPEGNPLFTVKERWSTFNESRDSLRLRFYSYETITAIPVLYPELVDLQIFPNPNPGIFKIDFEASVNDMLIQVFNLLGQLLYEEKIDHPICHKYLNLSSLTEGNYILQLKVGPNYRTKKIQILK